VHIIIVDFADKICPHKIPTLGIEQMKKLSEINTFPWASSPSAFLPNPGYARTAKTPQMAPRSDF
jgi:hypothetical protein